ncbi:BrnT family toxin [Crocosphaera chwakensis]|uniref:BrnT family toxin n=1 Tax=Crocosphaera chwakensis TaxID=2546361 RepID=UPI000307D67D|nr:BrnT family toxin [Crocosphaera chwakensis]
MDFQWDEKKHQTNIKKHGFDFIDAWEIFESPMLIELDSRQNYEEERYIEIGFLRQYIVVVVFIELNDSVIRIISLRKALKHEQIKFTKYIRNQLGEN